MSVQNLSSTTNKFTNTVFKRFTQMHVKEGKHNIQFTNPCAENNKRIAYFRRPNDLESVN